LSLIVPQVAKGPLGFQVESANQERVDYRARPLRTIIEVEACLQYMQRCLPAVTAPTLLIHSRTDDFVPSDSMPNIYQALGSSQKEMLWIEESDHVMTVDVAAEEVFRATSSFISGLTQ
jgi:carboxylesterase